MTFSILTFGCKVNSCESAAAEEQFLSAGYTRAEDGGPADVYIINSCAVTGAGVKKARQAVSHCRSLNPDCITVLCGCYPQAYPDEALRDCHADIITGNADKSRLTELVAQFLAGHERVSCVSPLSREFDERSSAADLDRTRAFIKIEDGCDRFCTYCIIPTARGRVRSRKPEDITRQAEQAAAAGNREIVLTGINIGCYGEDIGCTPADAVMAAQVPGIERVRLGSLEADTLTDREIERLKACEKLCPHFHLSLQSGSDAVLQRMKRRYTTAEYSALVEKLRSAFPGCAITTDIMVGFPGETDEEFAQSMDFAEKTGFAKIHVFPYSIRRGTVAGMRTNQVPPQIKSARAKEMNALADRLEREFLERQTGSIQTVLIEKRTSPDYCNGFTDSYILVRIYGEDISRHTLARVKIIGAQENYCTGTTDFKGE
ncbi:MAG: tRNA (N(6)-L-threonylcarbamoyladenosine(37)-C(2))-methylthiotransferase MtaB [Oscillospiraceae bacterium]|nr:tRNA (N(6)-L-threonylcarbamoyladenosine(37)-C(2))-methylthiotransferase MtaB [Oscillospiraceae bacterium]